MVYPNHSLRIRGVGDSLPQQNGKRAYAGEARRTGRSSPGQGQLKEGGAHKIQGTPHGMAKTRDAYKKLQSRAAGSGGAFSMQNTMLRKAKAYSGELHIEKNIWKTGPNSKRGWLVAGGASSLRKPMPGMGVPGLRCPERYRPNYDQRARRVRLAAPTISNHHARRAPRSTRFMGSTFLRKLKIRVMNEQTGEDVYPKSGAKNQTRRTTCSIHISERMGAARHLVEHGERIMAEDVLERNYSTPTAGAGPLRSPLGPRGPLRGVQKEECSRNRTADLAQNIAWSALPLGENADGTKFNAVGADDPGIPVAVFLAKTRVSVQGNQGRMTNAPRALSWPSHSRLAITKRDIWKNYTRRMHEMEARHGGRHLNNARVRERRKRSVKHELQLPSKTPPAGAECKDSTYIRQREGEGKADKWRAGWSAARGPGAERKENAPVLPPFKNDVRSDADETRQHGAGQATEKGANSKNRRTCGPMIPSSDVELVVDGHFLGSCTGEATLWKGDSLQTELTGTCPLELQNCFQQNNSRAVLDYFLIHRTHVEG
ncbi:hypothetical protein DFH06DRAFT_1128015 [Mycena polygramma]|nr:hypothetical protein DFH06DRAFT_1128015 [Mycena polygramma]